MTVSPEAPEPPPVAPPMAPQPVVEAVNPPAPVVESVQAPPAPPAAVPPASASETSPMVPWIATKQFTIDLFPSWSKTEGDKEWSLGAVTVDVTDVASRLDAMISALNEDQWEIKLVVPLDKSLTYHEHQKVSRAGSKKDAESVLAAFGLGWAAGATSSLMIVCQRTEWLDAGEYKARVAARRAKVEADAARRDRAAIVAHNAAVNAKITAEQKRLEHLKTGVEVRKSGFLRGEKFFVNGVEFPTRSEAEAALRVRIGEVEADLAALPRQLKAVPPEV